jgi:hypothetical protein
MMYVLLIVSAAIILVYGSVWLFCPHLRLLIEEPASCFVDSLNTPPPHDD